MVVDSWQQAGYQDEPKQIVGEKLFYVIEEWKSCGRGTFSESWAIGHMPHARNIEPKPKDPKSKDPIKTPSTPTLFCREALFVQSMRYVSV